MNDGWLFSLSPVYLSNEAHICFGITLHFPELTVESWTVKIEYLRGLFNIPAGALKRLLDSFLFNFFEGHKGREDAMKLA